MASDDLLTPWDRFRRWRWWWQALAWVVLPPVPVVVWAASQRQGRAMAWGLVVLVTGAWLTIGLQADDQDGSDDASTGASSTATTTTEGGSSSSSTTVAITSPPTTPAVTTPTAPPTTAPPPAPGAGPVLDQLVIAPEASDVGYDRDLFEHWIDADSDGCDTRCEVLEAEQRTDLPGLPGGGWLSSYDGYTTPDPTELEIDHVVALAEAWRSGANNWDAARREAFANDLEHPAALIAVTAASNRSKNDRDPASWQPPNQGAWCEFATAWATTKVRWGLSADQAEVDAMRAMLTDC